MANPVVYFEIGGRDKDKAAAFFGKLFDWKITPDGPAATVNTGGVAAGGINGHLTALGHEPHHYVTVYVEVDDVAAYLAKAEGLGGKTIVSPVEIPKGTFAWFADPDGNVIGLWKPK